MTDRVLRTEAIKKFLVAHTRIDLADSYNPGMEVQVNVAQENGQMVEGEFKGKKWRGWTDGITTWKPFRIPYNANTSPVYEDVPMSYNLEKYAEGIGMTGWNFLDKKSIWVAYDFDAITGHSEKHAKKLTESELKEVRDALCEVPWVTVRYSTSGNGLHLYVYLGTPVETANHNEHAALARAILGQLAALTGKDLQSKVDTCGANIWCWHRKMEGTKGLAVIKKGVPLLDIPSNWREHIDVITGKRRRVMPTFVADSDVDDYEKIFEELTSQKTKTPLDEQHLALIDYLKQVTKYNTWYDNDNCMLVTHTLGLKQAHSELGLKGIFETNSEGTDITHNCFCYPLKNGAWVVRRYTLGTAESSTWEQDKQGYTKCYFNRDPDLKTAAIRFDGVEHPSGGFQFEDAESAQNAARTMGVDIEINPMLFNRQTKLKSHKDGRLIVELEYSDKDNPKEMKGWLHEGKKWKRIFNTKNDPIAEESSIGNYDDSVRHIIDIEGQDAGWYIKSEGAWQLEPINHVNLFLSALGLDAKEIKSVLGSCVTRSWRVVSIPFESEYPGDRRWNKNAPQFMYPPSEDLDNLSYPTWQSVLSHCGSGLDEFMKDNAWAMENGILTGADYLKCWIASVLQKPHEPLPYLFFYGDQDCGKSIFHEALSLLVTKGVTRADQALTADTFNGELENAIVCVTEETDLGANKSRKIENRIKDWVTSRTILIRHMYQTPRTVPNLTHWIQCSNNREAVPIFPGDTRIVFLYVKALSPEQKTAKRILEERLKKEAPDFLAALLNLEIPECNDRLNIPVISTPDKFDAEAANMTPLQEFIKEKCFYVPGATVSVSDFYDQFQLWAPPEELSYWTKVRVNKNLGQKFPKGRLTDGHHYIGNISFTPPDPQKDANRKKLILSGDGMLRQEGSV